VFFTSRLRLCLAGLLFSRERGRFPSPAFRAPDWDSVFPTTAQGTGVKYRVPAAHEWMPVDVRVLKLTMNNTSYADQVGQGESTLCRWFRIGGDDPPRRYAVIYHDWVLFRNKLKATSMSESTRKEMQRARSERRATAAGGAGGGDDDDGDPTLRDGDAPVADGGDGSDGPSERSIASLEAWLETNPGVPARQGVVKRSTPRASRARGSLSARACVPASGDNGLGG
jgi:hypothetical protein